MPIVLVELFPGEIELLGLDDFDEEALQMILRERIGLPAKTDKPDTEATEG